MLVILIAALTHHVQEKHATLRGIDHVLERRRKNPEIWHQLTAWILARWHCHQTLFAIAVTTLIEIAFVHPHFSDMPISPGTPPLKSTIWTRSLYPRGRNRRSQN